MWQKSGRQVDRSGAAAPDHPGESGDGPMTTAPHATAPNAAAPNATIGRRKLRTALRRAREEAGYTQEQVARAMEWSLSKLIRIEAGIVGLSTTDLKALVDLYRIEDADQVQTLIELARVSRKKPWWFAHKDSLDAVYTKFLGLESGASALRSFQSIAMPGLFQTRAYATEVSTQAWIGDPLSPATIEEWVTVRLARQREVLDRPEPLTIVSVLDEGVLRHVVGNADVMGEQLDHLVELAGRPSMTIQVVPFTAGVPLYLNSFVLLSFPDPEDTDVVYMEGTHGQVFVEDRTRIGQYQDAFERLRQKALDPAESVALIRKVAGELR
jgi:transcriptional regulator with XRE-family HTH domain